MHRVLHVEGDQRAGLFEARANTGNLSIVRQRIGIDHLSALGYLPRLSIDRDEIDMRRTLLLHFVVNARPVRRPADVLRRTRELTGPKLLASTRVVHQVETGHVIGKLLLVISGVGDPAAIGRDLRISVGADPCGQRLDLKSLQIDRIDLAVTAQVFSIRLSNRGDVNRLSVGCPFGSVVIVFSRGDLARRASEDRVEGVHLGEALRQRTSSIRGPGQPVDDHRRFRPLRIARFLGQLNREDWIIVGFKRSERDQFAVWRPVDSRRRLFEMSKLSGLARVYPKDVQLVGAVAVREKGNALAVGRPNRLTIAPGPTGELSCPRAVAVDNPKVTYALIFDFINPGSGEDDLLTVRRDGRIADALHVHESLFVERAFVGSTTSP